MRYVMGLDGGGTKTACAIADETGRILGRGLGGPMNMSFVSAAVARQSINDAVAGAFAQAGAQVAQIEVAVAGSAGPVEVLKPDFPAPVRRWHTAYEHGLNFACCTDAPYGCVVLAGTGSFAWARGPDGRQHRVDGKGALMGDEGSAYDVARRALVHVGRALDRRGPPTVLRERIALALGADPEDPRGISRKLYGENPAPRHVIAGLARTVTAAAMEGDRVALAVCREAAAGLTLSAYTVCRETGLLEVPFDLCLTGGVIAWGGPVAGELVRRLRRRGLRLTPRYPRFEPVVGGLLLGIEQLGIARTQEIIANLQRGVVA